MLFTYKYLENHPIYQLHNWIEQVFLTVWCEASTDKPYSIDLLPEPIKELTMEIHDSEKVEKDYLYGPIEKIYVLFQQLDQSTIGQLRKAYLDNNNIEQLCKGETDCEPFQYDNLEAINSDLKGLIDKLCKQLFNNLIRLKLVTDRLGADLDDHYNKFFQQNLEKCPFCGLDSILGANHSKRDAYDHYLPKDLYPFNSINFRNLAPMCPRCNSSYKLRTDPLKGGETLRRKSFYIYDEKEHPGLSVDLHFKKSYTDDMQPTDLELEVTLKDHEEEVETWMDVFGIEERYKAKCLPGSDGKYWHMQVYDELMNFRDNPKEFEKEVSKMIQRAEKYPLSESNLIKAAFLKGVKGQLRD